MSESKLASSRLLVLGSAIGLGIILSGCSKGEPVDCHAAFTANPLLLRASHQSSPFEAALSELSSADTESSPKQESDGVQSSATPQGFVALDQQYSHYNLQRTIEDALGLEAEFLSDLDKYLEPLNEFWN